MISDLKWRGQSFKERAKLGNIEMKKKYILGRENSGNKDGKL